MYYQIKNTLTECSAEDIKNRKFPYVAIVSLEEFEEQKNLFDMGIDLDLEAESDDITEIQVNYDSLTGSFAIPDCTSAEIPPHTFLFAIDERGIVIIDDDGTAQKILDTIQSSKRWKFPSLERFLYDFLEGILAGDLLMLERYEKEMAICCQGSGIVIMIASGSGTPAIVMNSIVLSSLAESDPVTSSIG